MRQKGARTDDLLMPTRMLGSPVPFARGQRSKTKRDRAGNVTDVHNLLCPRVLLRTVNSILHATDHFH